MLLILATIWQEQATKQGFLRAVLAEKVTKSGRSCLTLRCNNSIKILTGCFILPMWLFISAVISYGMVFSAGKAIQNTDIGLQDVWNKFKLDFWRLVGTGLAQIVYLLVLIIFSFIGARLLSVSTGDYLSIPVWRQIVITYLVGPIFANVIFTSSLGIIFQQMGVFQSLGNGIKVFWAKINLFIFLGYLNVSVSFILAIATIIFLAMSGKTINYVNYTAINGNIYFQIIQTLSWFAFSPLLIMARLLIYFGEISAQEN